MSAIESLELDQSGDESDWLSSVASESVLQHSRLEIVFIDENTPDYQLLVRDLQHSVSGLGKSGTKLEIVVIPSGENGLHLITDTLSGYSNVDAIHLVSHGSDGNVNIGNVALNSNTFTNYQSELEKWGDAFTENGDLLIYGCDFSSTSNGIALGEKISAVVGVDIASSNDATGSQDLQADWQLEQVVGVVETPVPFSAELQSTYLRSLANVIDVTTEADVVDGTITSFDDLMLDPGADGKISLREAIIAANIQSGSDIINLPAGVYDLTIPTNSHDGPDIEDDLDITSDVTIRGADTATTIINNALAEGRVIEVHATGNLTVSDVTIQGGYDREGTGILNDGVFSASSILVKNNNAGNQNGAGLKNFGVATLEYSDFEGNTSNGAGGGIYNVAGSSIIVSHSNFIGNRSDSNRGGGIANQGSAEIHNSSFYSNHSNGGGGLASTGGTTTVSNSTFSMNTAANNGGGIFASSGVVTVSYSTVSENEARNGAGIHNESGTISIESSIVAGNVSTTSWGEIEVGGNVSSGGYNVITDPGPGGFAAISSDMMGVDPQLQNYALHGGVTSSYSLLASSPAVDAANVTTSPVTDQRDVTRDATPDIGAYEFDNGTGSGDVPQLTLSLSNNTYLENTPLVVDSAVVITDIDSPDFDGGVFTVASTGITEITDKVYVNSVGTGVGEIDVVGTSVRYEGVVIGTWSGGVGSTPLQVTLNSTADATVVTALARNIAFTSTSESPSLQTRTLAFSVSDGDTGTSSVKTIDIAVTASNDPPVIAVPVLQPFINEIHYDNTGTDTGEGIEIAATAGTDLTGWTLSLYSGGAVYDTVALAGIIPNQVFGVGALFFSVIPLQNGANDGIALVDSSGNVIEFLSYEGTMTAIAGPAAGMTSQDILVTESSATPAGHSLQRTDSGNGFSWANASPNTFGAINPMQAFVSAGVQATDEDVALIFSSANGNSIVVSDADTSANLFVTLSVSSGQLAFSSTPGAAGQSINFTGSLAQINNELEGLRYIPDPDFSGLDTLSVSIDDQDNSNGTNETDSETIDIQVDPVNDAPYLDSASVLSLDAQSEDDIAPPGTSLTDILGSSLPADVITDVDSGAVEGIALTGIDNTNGVWQYFTAGGGWLAVPSVSDASALLLDQASSIRFLPDPDYNGTSSIVLRAWDQTDGLISGSTGINVATNGGTEAYSTDSMQATVNITPVADNPVVTLDADNSSNATSAGDYITTFIAGGSSVLIADSDALLSDVDAPVLSRLDVKMTNLPDGGLESLQAASFAGFISSYDSTTGRLVIVPTAGSAPIVDFNAILKTVVYSNTSVSTDTTNRIVNVIAYDPDGLTDLATTTVIVLADSTAPTVNVNAVATVAEGGQIVIDNTALRSTDDLQPLSALNYSISSAPLSGYVAFTNAPNTPINQFTQDKIDLGQVIYVHNGNEQVSDSFTFAVDDSAGNTTPAETFNIAVNRINDAPVLNVPGPQTIDEGGQLVFTNAAGNSITGYDVDASTVQITLSAIHGTVNIPGVGAGSSVTHTISPSQINSLFLGARYSPESNYNGTDVITVAIEDLGQTGSGGAHAVVEQIPVTINAINDAPLGSDGSLSLVEDQAVTLTDLDFGYSDLEGHNFTSVIIASTPINGTLKLSGTAIVANDVIPVSAIQLNQLAFEPDANVNGNVIPVFEFQVRDDGGTVNGGQNTDPLPNTISLDIASVNDAPSGDNKTIALTEDSAYVIAGVDFGFSDPMDMDNFAAVTITQVPSNGTLTLAGAAVTANQMISITDITNGDLVYTPGSTGSGIGFSELQFLVHDDGGIVNGGQDISLLANTLTFDVGRVNTAPSAGDSTISIFEDNAYVLQGIDFGFSDANDNFAAITITQLPSSGTLTLSGVAVTANQLISITSISNNDLVFTPAANANGNNYSDFTFLVHDDGGTDNGGQDVATIANTLTFTVVAINDAPTSSGSAINVSENTSYTFSRAEFSFIDVDSDALSDILIATDPAVGSLLLNGQQLLAPATVTANELDNGLLVFVPVPNTSGANYASLEFRVRDAGGIANGGIDTSSVHELLIHVNDVNSAPAGVDTTIVIAEDTPRLLVASDFGFADPDQNSLHEVLFFPVDGSGSLQFGDAEITSLTAVSIADINTGKVVFIPNPHESGSGYAAIDFLVRDSGGTGNGGVDTAVTINTLTIDVITVNDAPLSVDKVLSVDEDQSYVFTSSDFGFSDPIEDHGFEEVLIDTVTGAGTLLLNGVPVNGVATISSSSIATGSLEFAPYPDTFGNGYAAIGYRVKDSGGTANGGLDTSQLQSTIFVNVSGVNDAPVGLETTVTAIEDTSLVLTVADFGFTDAENHQLQSVVLSAGPASGVLLAAGVPVNANDTVAVSRIAANDLVYQPDPDSTVTDSIEFMVVDNGGTVNNGTDTSTTPATISIEVGPVNDAPSGQNSSISITEDTSYVLNASDFGFSDAVEQHNFSAVLVVGISGDGLLSLDGNNIGSAGMISIADINAGLLEFTPSGNTFGSNNASIDFQVVDDGGESHGGVDTDQSINTLSFDVVSINDAPTGKNGVVNTIEDTELTLSTSDFGFSDSDNNQFDAVEIVSQPSSGTLLLDGQPVSVEDVVPTNLISQGQFTYIPEPDSTAVTSFDFLVIDDGGVVGGGNNKDLTSNSLQINITTVNDAPAGIDSGISLTDNTQHQFSRFDFGFTDLDNDEFQSVIIEQLPAAGALSLNGSPVNAGQIIDVTDLDLGGLVYKPSLNQSGLDKLLFRVQDDGGVALGGQDTSVALNQISIDVEHVNLPPVGSDTTISVVEDEAYTITAADFGFSDVVDKHSFIAITLGAIEGGGTLKLAEQRLSTGDVVTVAEIDAGLLVFQSSVSTDNHKFGFRVHDNGDSQLGNTVSAIENSMTFLVEEVNDAPVLTNKGMLIDEGGDKNISAADLSVIDVDDTAADLLFVLQSIPENGVLTVDDEIVSVGSNFTMEHLLQNRVNYIHNGSETSTDFFDFSLADGGEDGVLPISSRFQIDVTEVIDPAPNLTDNSFSVRTGSKFDLNNGDVLATGEEQLVAGVSIAGENLSISIQTQPEHGVLVLNNDGTFSYTHDGSANIEDSFTYRVMNEDGVSATATISILVEPPIEAAVNAVLPLTNKFPEVIVEAASNETVVEIEVETLNEVSAPDEEEAETTTSSDSQTVSDSFLASEPLVDPEALILEIDSDALVTESGVYSSEIDHSRLLLVERELKSLGVKKHAAIGSLEDFGDNTNLKTKTVQLVVEIQPSLSAIVNSRQFQNSLANVSNDLDSARNDTLTRYQIGNDVAVSVSISTTAGILAWMLRGGALFGSLMAATPLWSAIDPLRISDADRRDKEDQQDKVEELFD